MFWTEDESDDSQGHNFETKGKKEIVIVENEKKLIRKDISVIFEKSVEIEGPLLTVQCELYEHE